MMTKITDYSNFYRQLSTAYFKDTHWILDLASTAAKKNRSLKIFFETGELSEKSLSFLLFRNLIPRDDLWNFLEWLERTEFFFDYDAVFDRFDDRVLSCSLRARDYTTLEMGEIPLEVEELLHH